MSQTAESCFGLMSDLSLLGFLTVLSTLAPKMDLFWTSAAGLDTMLVIAVLEELELACLLFLNFFQNLTH